MKEDLEVGYRYGCLEIISSYKEPDNIGLVRMLYELECDCGKRLTIKARNWHKNKRDCGCGKGNDQILVPLYLRVPVWIKLRIDRYATDTEQVVSKAALNIVELGLVQLDGTENE